MGDKPSKINMINNNNNIEKELNSLKRDCLSIEIGLIRKSMDKPHITSDMLANINKSWESEPVVIKGYPFLSKAVFDKNNKDASK